MLLLRYGLKLLQSPSSCSIQRHCSGCSGHSLSSDVRCNSYPASSCPQNPPPGVGVVHLGQRVPELSFVLNDEAGSEVEAAALEVMVERVVVVGRLISAAVVVGVLTWGALRASEDRDRG